ncbi:hypothetical protein ACNKHT_19425 [Shigella flexneri]
MLKNNGLHIELQIDANGQMAKSNPAHMTMLSSKRPSVAVLDCEDQSRRLMRKIKSCCTAIWA